MTSLSRSRGLASIPTTITSVLSASWASASRFGATEGASAPAASVSASPPVPSSTTIGMLRSAADLTSSIATGPPPARIAITVSSPASRSTASKRSGVSPPHSELFASRKCVWFGSSWVRPSDARRSSSGNVTLPDRRDPDDRNRRVTCGRSTTEGRHDAGVRAAIDERRPGVRSGVDRAPLEEPLESRLDRGIERACPTDNEDDRPRRREPKGREERLWGEAGSGRHRSRHVAVLEHDRARLRRAVDGVGHRAIALGDRLGHGFPTTARPLADLLFEGHVVDEASDGPIADSRLEPLDRVAAIRPANPGEPLEVEQIVVAVGVLARSQLPFGAQVACARPSREASSTGSPVRSQIVAWPEMSVRTTNRCSRSALNEAFTGTAPSNGSQRALAVQQRRGSRRVGQHPET